MTDPILRAAGLGICFARGSRREMLRRSLYAAFFGIPARARAEDEGLFWALRNLDLAVFPAQRLAVCGCNGSGKTTLMRLLAGVYRPDEGSLDTGGSTRALLSLGAGIGHHLSGRENVFLSGTLYGLKRSEIIDRYEEIRGFAELDEATMRTPVRYYSSGMRTRLGFSIATTLSPEILLLDEILSVGDVAFRRKSSARLRECSDRAHCLVISSHNVRFLKEHCDSAIWLHRGRVMACGEAKPVLDEYTGFMSRAG